MFSSHYSMSWTHAYHEATDEAPTSGPVGPFGPVAQPDPRHGFWDGSDIPRPAPSSQSSEYSRAPTPGAHDPQARGSGPTPPYAPYAFPAHVPATNAGNAAMATELVHSQAGHGAGQTHGLGLELGPPAPEHFAARHAAAAHGAHSRAGVADLARDVEECRAELARSEAGLREAEHEVQSLRARLAHSYSAFDKVAGENHRLRCALAAECDRRVALEQHIVAAFRDRVHPPAPRFDGWDHHGDA